MRLGRRLSSGIAGDPPAPAAPAEPDAGAIARPRVEPLASPDERAAEIVAAAARRELSAER